MPDLDIVDVLGVIKAGATAIAVDADVSRYCCEQVTRLPRHGATLHVVKPTMRFPGGGRS